jgi:glycerol-3-phosphate dehydrogenase
VTLDGRPREASLDRLAGGEVDLLVIGAGVVGAATALAAAAAGARVAVVDRGDVAGATSSASSKLLHGGLRYLGMGDVALVRQSHAERQANARVVAPHLARPMTFMVPVRASSPLPLWKVRAGVATYAALARWMDGRSGRVTAVDARRRVPALRLDGLQGVVAYHDHVTHDARLTLTVLQEAARRGADVLNHAEVVDLRTVGGRIVGADLVDRLGGGAFTVSARAVVNATGPWVDSVRRLETPSAGTSVSLSKGVHLLLRGSGGWSAAVTTPLENGRVSFAIPWEEMLLLGTTDDPFDGDPDGVAATAADEARVLSEAAESLDAELLAPERVVARMAGLRVLPLSAEATSRVHRETVMSRGPAGMITVAGGKLTMWRLIGRDAARMALEPIGLGGARVPDRPLPGAAVPETVERALQRSHPELAGDVRRNLVRHYGTLAFDLLRAGREDARLVQRIHPDGPDIWVQVRQAVRREWAATVDDVLLRRTTVALRGHDEQQVRERVARMLAEAA